MEGYGCIYYIHCKESNKGYVGQSVHADHKIRYATHWEKSKKKPTILRNAMNKYGYDAFTTQSLCIVPHSALNNMEAYWAEQLETYIWDTPGGYNMIICGFGGTKGLKFSIESKLKLSQSQNKRWLSQEAHKNHSKSISKIYTDEYKRKIAGIASKPGKSGELLIYERCNSWCVRQTKYMPTKTFKTLEEAIIYRDSFLIPYKNGTSP